MTNVPNRYLLGDLRIQKKLGREVLILVELMVLGKIIALLVFLGNREGRSTGHMALTINC